MVVEHMPFCDTKVGFSIQNRIPLVPLKLVLKSRAFLNQDVFQDMRPADRWWSRPPALVTAERGHMRLRKRLSWSVFLSVRSTCRFAPPHREARVPRDVTTSKSQMKAGDTPLLFALGCEL